MSASKKPRPLNFAGLVERLVPVFAELLATLASQDPLRMSFAGIAEKTVLDIAEALRADGMSQEAVAAALGLTITGFQGKMKRLRAAYRDPDTAGEEDVTLLERVYRRVAESDEGVASWAQLERYFKGVKRDTLGGVLHHLVQYDILSLSGRGAARTYRVARGSSARRPTLADAQVVLYRSGPLSVEELALELGVPVDGARELLADLAAAGTVREATSPDATARYRATGYYIPTAAAEGYESALWDHVSTVVRVVTKKVRLGRHLARPDDRIGGTTFTFDVPPDHPLAEEIGAFLADARVRMDDWHRRAVELESQPGERDRITIYTGQMVEPGDPVL